MGMLLRRHEAENKPVLAKVEVYIDKVDETSKTEVKTETKAKKKAKK